MDKKYSQIGLMTFDTRCFNLWGIYKMGFCKPNWCKKIYLTYMKRARETRGERKGRARKGSVPNLMIVVSDTIEFTRMTTHDLNLCKFHAFKDKSKIPNITVAHYFRKVIASQLYKREEGGGQQF